VTRVYSPLSIRRRLRDYARYPTPDRFSEGPEPGAISVRARGTIVGLLNKALFEQDAEGQNIADVNRRLVCGWMFGDDEAPLDPLSSKEMTPQMFNAIRRWMAENVDGAWRERLAFPAEAQQALTLAKKDLMETIRDLVGLEIDPPTLGSQVAAWERKWDRRGLVESLDLELDGQAVAAFGVGGELAAVTDDGFEAGGEELVQAPVMPAAPEPQTQAACSESGRAVVRRPGGGVFL
jgi:hypothetical protein